MNTNTSGNSGPAWSVGFLEIFNDRDKVFNDRDKVFNDRDKEVCVKPRWLHLLLALAAHWQWKPMVAIFSAMSLFVRFMKHFYVVCCNFWTLVLVLCDLGQICLTRCFAISAFSVEETISVPTLINFLQCDWQQQFGSHIILTKCFAGAKTVVWTDVEEASGGGGEVIAENIQMNRWSPAITEVSAHIQIWKVSKIWNQKNRWSEAIFWAEVNARIPEHQNMERFKNMKPKEPTFQKLCPHKQFHCNC